MAFVAVHLSDSMIADLTVGPFPTRAEAVAFGEARIREAGAESPVTSEVIDNVTWINWDKQITSPNAWLIMPLESI